MGLSVRLILILLSLNFTSWVFAEQTTSTSSFSLQFKVPEQCKIHYDGQDVLTVEIEIDELDIQRGYIVLSPVGHIDLVSNFSTQYLVTAQLEEAVFTGLMLQPYPLSGSTDLTAPNCVSNGPNSYCTGYALGEAQIEVAVKIAPEAQPGTYKAPIKMISTLCQGD